MRIVSTVAVAAVLVTALLGAIARPAQAATLDSFESDLVAQVNAFRAGRGLPTLTVTDTLTAAAKWMSADMAVNNYFSHTSLDGRSPTQRMADAGYPAYQTWTGEDLAAGYASATTVLSGWIDSPAHYAVLTNPNYRAIGVGRSYTTSSAYGSYWAADFGGIVDSGAPVVRAAPAPVVAYDAGFHDAWVGPGQVGWFQFQIRAPATPGTYRLDVRAVIDGATWLEDQGIYFTITVR